MKVIYNRLIPFGNFRACNLFGVLFVRVGTKITYILKNHEAIHTAQMKELGYIGFYLLYFFEWLYRLIFHTGTAYRGISFEREAYMYERKTTYLKRRKRFAMWRKSTYNQQ